MTAGRPGPDPRSSDDISQIHFTSAAHVLSHGGASSLEQLTDLEGPIDLWFGCKASRAFS